MANAGEEFKIFTCTANVALAKSIADYLGTQLCRADVRRFSDGEVFDFAIDPDAPENANPLRSEQYRGAE